jgi:acylphosphatase
MAIPASSGRQGGVRRLRGTVFGEVQGVGFRSFTRHQAEQLGLTGWVKNNPDGSVSFEVEGPPGITDAFLEQIKIGPRFAVVCDLRFDSREDDISPRFRSFSIAW